MGLSLRPSVDAKKGYIVSLTPYKVGSIFFKPRIGFPWYEFVHVILVSLSVTSPTDKSQTSKDAGLAPSIFWYCKLTGAKLS